MNTPTNALNNDLRKINNHFFGKGASTQKHK